MMSGFRSFLPTAFMACAIATLPLLSTSCGTSGGGGNKYIQVVGGSLRPSKAAYAMTRSSDVVSLPKSSAVLPTRVDLRDDGIIPPVQNQQWNSCVGWSLAYYVMSAVEARHRRGQGAWLDMTDPENWYSPDFIYSQRDTREERDAALALRAAQGDPEPTAGCIELDEDLGCMRPERALEVLNTHGCCRYTWMCTPDTEEGPFRACTPGNTLDRGLDSRPPAWMTYEGAGWSRPRCYVRFGSIDELEQNTVDRMRSWLHEQGTPIAIVVRMREGWVTYDGSTRLPVAEDGPCPGATSRAVCLDAGGTDLGGQHMMTIIGYDSSFPAPTGAPGECTGSFLVINQWGDKWGDHGTMWIPCAQLERIWIGGYGLIRSPEIIWGRRESLVCAQTADGGYTQVYPDGNDVPINLLTCKEWQALTDARESAGCSLPNGDPCSEIRVPPNRDWSDEEPESPACADLTPSEAEEALGVYVTAVPLDLAAGSTAVRTGKVGGEFPGGGGTTVLDAEDWFVFRVPDGVRWRVQANVSGSGVETGLFTQSLAGISPRGATLDETLCPGRYFLEVRYLGSGGSYALSVTPTDLGPAPAACSTTVSDGDAPCAIGLTTVPVTPGSQRWIRVPTGSRVTLRTAAPAGCARVQLLAALVSGQRARYESRSCVPGGPQAEIELHPLPAPDRNTTPEFVGCATQPGNNVYPDLATHPLPPRLYPRPACEAQAAACPDPDDTALVCLAVRALDAQGAPAPGCLGGSHTVMVEVCAPEGGEPVVLDPEIHAGLEGLWQHDAAEDAFFVRAAGTERRMWVLEVDRRCEAPVFHWLGGAGLADLGGAIDAPTLAPPRKEGDHGDSRFYRAFVPASVAGDVYVALDPGAQGPSTDYVLEVFREYTLALWPTVDRPDVARDDNNTPGRATRLVLGQVHEEQLGFFEDPVDGRLTIDWHDSYAVDTGFASPDWVTVSLRGRDARNFSYLSIWNADAVRRVPIWRETWWPITTVATQSGPAAPLAGNLFVPNETNRYGELRYSVRVGSRCLFMLENWGCHGGPGDPVFGRGFPYEIEVTPLRAPDCRMLTRNAAPHLVQRFGVTPVWRWVPEAPYGPGDPTNGVAPADAAGGTRVHAQDPPAGAPLTPGSEIVLSVEREPVVPDFVGHLPAVTWRHAVLYEELELQDLKATNFVWDAAEPDQGRPVHELFFSIGLDLVVTRMDPAPGTPMRLVPTNPDGSPQLTIYVKRVPD